MSSNNSHPLRTKSSAFRNSIDRNPFHRVSYQLKCFITVIVILGLLSFLRFFYTTTYSPALSSTRMSSDTIDEFAITTPHLSHYQLVKRAHAKVMADLPSAEVSVYSGWTLGAPYSRAAQVDAKLDICVVADKDKSSRQVNTEEKGGKQGGITYASQLLRGTITRLSGLDHPTAFDPTTHAITSDLPTYGIAWEATPLVFSTTLNEAGRGFELSELKWFNGELYTADDRTGIVFQLSHFGGSGPTSLIASPQYILMGGDGTSFKGQKHEWMTVKNDVLYLGSIGKEYTNNAGEILHEENFWVVTISMLGHVVHHNWTRQYMALRRAVKCDHPGYLIHEAMEWSDVHQKWFILPRRVSQAPYSSDADERKGSNLLLIANEAFTDISVRTIGTVTPERGFSSFKFLPNTADTIIMALKSSENDAAGTATTYLTVFDIDGHVLCPETELPDGIKYEGIETLSNWSPRPDPIRLT